tara:strand:+ start:2847 stop:3047 length:201 start_codon:yes stop_codon:yes gene_type:complete
MKDTVIIKRNTTTNLFTVDVHTIEFGGLPMCNELIRDVSRDKADEKLKDFFKHNKSKKFNIIREEI